MKEYKKEIVGMVAGNFDLLHPGYILTFEEAKRHCDKFLVFLQKDPSLHRKSKYKPVIPPYDRYKALMAIKYIDEVYMYQTEEELYELIKFWKPDVRILGEDYMGKSFTGDDLPPKIIYTTRSHGWSTTKLKDKITKQTIEQNPVFNEMFGMMESKRVREKNRKAFDDSLGLTGKDRSDEWQISQFNRNRAPEDQVKTIEEMNAKIEETF
tara:strand:+ start:921 stop:1550 length:630 start_codon:yes stop_codon:yes gene_type:complete